MMFHPQNHDPSIDLRPFGWAPGDYINGTCHCGDTIYGAKRCTRCYDCAMKAHTRHHSPEAGELRLLRDRAEELQDDLRFYMDIERMNQKLKKDSLTALLAVRRQICSMEKVQMAPTKPAINLSELSFGNAFAVARKRDLKTFIWNDQLFNTKLAEDQA